MKMADVFKTDLPIKGGTLTHVFMTGQVTDFDFLNKRGLRVSPTQEKSEAITHAINAHDELESENARLKGLLEEVKPWLARDTTYYTGASRLYDAIEEELSND